MSILSKLYTKPIKSYIRSLINSNEAKDFYSLDELDREYLVGLGIQALDGDIDIVLSSKANTSLALFLTSYDSDHKDDLVNSLKESTQEIFAEHFNQMILEEIDNQRHEEFFEAGRSRYIDQTNGEVRYI